VTGSKFADPRAIDGGVESEVDERTDFAEGFAGTGQPAGFGFLEAESSVL
jgi:hypothetical protein